MSGSALRRATWIALCLLLALPLTARAAESGSGVDIIGLETGPSSGITVRQAEDLASLVDDGTTRRLVPMVGHGGQRTLADLLDGRGIDMAFLQLDVLDDARVRKLFPGFETKISYIAKLNYVEFHLLARAEFTSVGDLAGQVVSAGPRDGDSFVTASQVFRRFLPAASVAACGTGPAPETLAPAGGSLVPGCTDGTGQLSIKG